MKKIMLVLTILFVTFILIGCSNQNAVISMSNYELDTFEVNNYSDASMAIIDGTISNAGLTLEFNYSGNDQGTTGTWFTILHFVDNEWNALPYITEDDFAWTMLAYIIEKNHSGEMIVNWEWLYGELSAGRYLIVKQFTNHRAPGDNDDYYLACEFTIE